jgi:hypothetical protein
MPADAVERKLAAILAADIAGFARKVKRVALVLLAATVAALLKLNACGNEGPALNAPG